MRQALEEAHSGLYRYSTKAEMTGPSTPAGPGSAVRYRSGSSLSSSAKRSRPSGAGTPACGRTTRLGRAIRSRGFPLARLPEGSRLKVLLNDTPDDQTIRPGMEVLEINGVKAADVVGRCLPLESGDGDIETGKRRHLGNGLARYYWAAIDPTPDSRSGPATQPGRSSRQRWTGVTEAERKENHNPVNDAVNAGIAKVRGLTKTFRSASSKTRRSPTPASAISSGTISPGGSRRRSKRCTRRAPGRSSSTCAATAAARTCTGRCWCPT